MGHVMRWGQSAYETAADLAMERDTATQLGWAWSSEPDAKRAPLDRAAPDVLVVTSKARVDEAVIDWMGGGWIVTTTSGFDHIDVVRCAQAGIRVARCPTARRDAVVSYALSALVGLMRRTDDLVGASREGRWARSTLPDLAPRGLHRATVVVVGFGVIGRAMTEVLTLLGAKVRVVDPLAAVPPGWAFALGDALDGADAVTLHCALTPSSAGLLDACALARLPDHAVVVNTARGEVLDVQAAVAAVASGALRGLACDVFPVEPYPTLAAAQHPRVWFTPHSAGFTHDLGERVAAGVATALHAIVAGERVEHEVRLADGG